MAYYLLSKNREEFMALVRAQGTKCTKEVREFFNENVEVLQPRYFRLELETLLKAEQLGGLFPGTSFSYLNAQGGISIARVCSLYELPDDMVNPYLYVFGGHMMAPFYAMEILRIYYKQKKRLLPFLTSGKEGNKGLFKKLYDRKEGIVIKTEYDAYCNIMAMLTSHEYAFANYEEFTDDDTAGNLIEMYEFALRHDLKEITLILCTGNPYYDKRLLAEWMYQLKDGKFAEVRINLVLVHCPLFVTFLKHAVPEARFTEIYAGYVAACLGPLAKDTITFDGKTTSEKPERYLMPGVTEADWEPFRDLIVNFSNMGWPNYQELLYGIGHEEAVANIILSDLFARNSYTTEEYDNGIRATVDRYKRFLDAKPSQSLGDYLLATTDQKFFAPKRDFRGYTD